MSQKICFIISCIVTASGFKVGDILNAEYLPSTLMIEEAEIDNAASGNYANVSTEGEIRDAFATMQFHRAKMNEYLCRSYVAEEILSGLEPKTVARLGLPMKKNYKNHRPADSLLKDQGSSSYRDWLSRSTLLDDVYRHYDVMMDQDDSDTSGTEEIESGEVTGYAVQSVGPKQSTINWGPNIYGVVGGGGGGDFGSPGGGYVHGPPVHEHHEAGGDEHHYYYHDEEDSGKGLALKELFDLALTALAFLAFGLFIANLIMTCILVQRKTAVEVEDDHATDKMMQTKCSQGGNQATVVSTMTTTTATGAGAATRGKRSLLDDNALNEMAYRVLTSIDELKTLYQGQSQVNRDCFRYALCQNNKYSRTLNGAKRLWLPMWSFGMSWLVGRLGEDRLSSLQAAVLGLGNVDCKTVYPSCKKSWI